MVTPTAFEFARPEYLNELRFIKLFGSELSTIFPDLKCSDGEWKDVQSVSRVRRAMSGLFTFETVKHGYRAWIEMNAEGTGRAQVLDVRLGKRGKQT